MDKGSASLFGTTLVITAAIVAGVYLLDRAQQSAASGSTDDRGWTTLLPSRSRDIDSSPPSPPSPRHPGPSPRTRSGAGSTNLTDNNSTTNTGNVSAENSPTGSANATIITCQHPEYGNVYSNAASCDEVDYDSRLSRAETFEAIPERERYSGTDYHSPENAAANSRSYSANKKQ